MVMDALDWTLAFTDHRCLQIDFEDWWDCRCELELKRGVQLLQCMAG